MSVTFDDPQMYTRPFTIKFTHYDLLLADSVASSKTSAKTKKIAPIPGKIRRLYGSYHFRFLVERFEEGSSHAPGL